MRFLKNMLSEKQPFSIKKHESEFKKAFHALYSSEYGEGL